MNEFWCGLLVHLTIGLAGLFVAVMIARFFDN